MTPEEKRRAYMAAYRAKHKQRDIAKRKAQYRANPEKYRNKQRQYYYGITPERAAELLASQGDRCAICRTDHPGGRGVWHLDHDHETDKVRGFLCQRCNSGLGFFQDQISRLLAAIQYLSRHGKRT